MSADEGGPTHAPAPALEGPGGAAPGGARKGNTGYPSAAVPDKHMYRGPGRATDPHRRGRKGPSGEEFAGREGSRTIRLTRMTEETWGPEPSGKNHRAKEGSGVIM